MVHKIIPLILGIVAIIFALWWNTTSISIINQFNQRIEKIAYDMQLNNKIFMFKQKISKEIVIVNVDNKSLKEEGRWPWSRKKMAELIDKMHEASPLAIIMDILPSEKQENRAIDILNTLAKVPQFSNVCRAELNANLNLFEEDPLFAKSLSEGQVYLPFVFLQNDLKVNELPPPLFSLPPQDIRDLNINKANGFVSSLPLFQKIANGTGFINAVPDSDGMFRRVAIITQFNNQIYGSLPLQAIKGIFDDVVELQVAEYGLNRKVEGVRIGSTLVPTDDAGYALIPFVGPSRTFPYYSAVDVLHDRLPKDALLGKIIIVGTTAVGLGDLYPTPVSTPYPGVEIQANIINGILNNNFSAVPEWTYIANLSFILIFGFIAAFVFPHLGPRMLSALIVFLPISLLALNSYVWIATGYIFSISGLIFVIVLIALVNILYGYFFESLRHQAIKSMFGQYVDKKHIEEMLNTNRSNLVLHSEDREMTVLFADIRNFTTISEDMKAEQLVAMLNTFFNAMTEIILNNNGTIDKYVGDEIMAFWGAPIVDKKHAEHAIDAALQMQKEAQRLSADEQVTGLAGIRMGIGINTGIMSVGDMGSKFHRNYTVLGDTVNIASRIEGLSKIYGGGIIVTEHTKSNFSQYVFQKLDKVRVQGKKASVVIYDVLCRTDELNIRLKAELKIYNRALDLYFNRRWEPALELFNELKIKYPNKLLYTLYVDRIMEFQKIPPPKDWDGTYISLIK